MIIRLHRPSQIPKKFNIFSTGTGKFSRAFDDTMGLGIHRSGWNECFSALSTAQLGIAIDDFVEQTISLKGGRFYHHEPFIAFFHYPPDEDIPTFVSDKHISRHEICSRPLHGRKVRST